MKKLPAGGGIPETLAAGVAEQSQQLGRGRPSCDVDVFPFVEEP